MVVPFRIKLLDNNDKSPTFLKEKYYFSISENSVNRTNIGLVQSFDSDLNDTVTYGIVSG